MVIYTDSQTNCIYYNIMKLGSSNLTVFVINLHVIDSIDIVLCTMSWYAYDHKRSVIPKASVDSTCTTHMSTCLYGVLVITLDFDETCYL